MQTHITARHFDLDPEVRRFAEERAGKFARFARDIHEVKLVVTAEKNRFLAEMTVSVNQHEVVSREESNEPRVAVDLAADRIDQQLRKLKEKRVEHRHAGLDADGRTSLSNGDEAAAGEVAADEPAADEA
jgi:ribosomal subunit interface protein